MGLKLNPLNENLFAKVVKIEERAADGTKIIRDML